MIPSTRRSSCDRVLIDLNTQCDFLLPDGGWQVAERDALFRNVRRLMGWVRKSRLPIVSSFESHRPEEPVNGHPRCCIDRTRGQKKLPFTLMSKRLVLHGDNTLDVPFDPFRRFQQLVFANRGEDFLSNPKADRLLNVIGCREAIVFGVGIERCIKASVLGLAARQVKITLLVDCCGWWSAKDADMALRKMYAKGAALLTLDQLIAGAEADERTAQEYIDRFSRLHAAAIRTPAAQTSSLSEGRRIDDFTRAAAKIKCHETAPLDGNGNGGCHRPEHGSDNGNGNGHTAHRDNGSGHGASPAVEAAELLQPVQMPPTNSAEATIRHITQRIKSTLQHRHHSRGTPAAPSAPLA